jgi:predicted O-methyltransferase YrrM
MSPKYVTLNDALYNYVVCHRSRANDPLLDTLRAETEALGDIARMLISREQGDFLTILTKLLNVWGGRVVEQPLTDPGGVAIDLLNRKLASDPRVESVLLPFADGLHLARKR